VKVLITGTNFLNKGAQLMMHAIVEVLRQWPEVDGIALPLESGSFAQRRSSGVAHLLGRKVDRAPWVEGAIAQIGNVIPRRLAGMRSFIRARDVGLVLDASGYIYSDRSGAGPSLRARRTYRRLTRSGALVVLLPQAFGPFDDEAVRGAFRDVVATASLAYARDPVSMQHLRAVAPGAVPLAMAPDFTLGLKGSGDREVIDRHRGRACLVPNARMLRDTERATGAWYLDVLGRVSNHLSASGLDPYFLLHESRDAGVADQVNARSATSIEIVRDEDPRALKGLIGSASVVVGSRYHALVSALASGVPALGIGWTHKYAALFADFGVTELIPANGTPAAEIESLLTQLADPAERRGYEQRLRAQTAVLAETVSEMWHTIRLIAAARPRE
jgi:colanic acid/amylovoran biosynthesis protein